MSVMARVLGGLVMLAAAGVLAQAPPATPDPTRTLAAEGIPGVIAAGTPTRLVRAGFDGTEGAIALDDGTLLFCEFNQNRVMHLDAAGTISTYVEDTNRSIGLALDRRGRLIATQSRDPRVAVLVPARAVLADRFEGQPLVRPNDLVVDRRGGIYFSDPLATPQTQFRDPPPGRPSLLFYLAPSGRLRRLTDEVTHPNGVQLSTNEKILYAVDGDRIVAFDVQRDGSVRNLRPFAEVAGGDGLAVDREDRLYVATEPGVVVFDAHGRRLGLIPAPVRIQSIAFGGADRRTLYAVGRGAVFRISLLARGVQGRAK